MKNTVSYFYRFSCLFLCLFMILFSVSNIYAGPVAENLEFEEDAANRLAQPVSSNEIENWPVGPTVGAQGAILIEANTGTILYAKNIHEKLYPASTTKILTTLVAFENAGLDEMVTFSSNAVFGIESGSSNMGMDVGESITMEQCLHGILIMSANEVCNAVAEHIAGSIPAFVDMMNQKATELGCLNSHFVTTNGLQDENHYTTAYDLAQIARAFFANETLTKISGTSYEVLPPSANQPDEIPMYTHNEITRGKYPYEGYIGGKTGYTSNAHQTLVTCAQRNGMKLICVVMKEDSPMQFTDTLALFDYGFQNFKKCNVSEFETGYTVDHTDFFQSDSEIFGSNETFFTIDKDSYIILPTNMDFSVADSEITFHPSTQDDPCVATVQYSYQNVPIGTASILLSQNTKDSYDFESEAVPSENSFETEDNIVFINIHTIILIVVSVIGILFLLFFLLAVLKNVHFSRKKRPKRVFKFRDTRPKRRRISNGKRKSRKEKKKELHF